MIEETVVVEAFERGRRQMILPKFRAWAQSATPETRAEGARDLARAYIYARSNEDQRRDAACVLTSFLDDPSPLVRKALAEALATALGAPHHIIVALAEDQAPIAAIVLAVSPVLSDAELIDCATTAESVAQSAIASRSPLSAAVATALAEVAAPDALVTLARNRAARLPPVAVRRMIERHADHAELREALLARSDLPNAARIDLLAATMRAMSVVVGETCGVSDERLKRIGREAKSRAAIAVADASCGWSGAIEIAQHLCEAGELTLNFAFRAILSGRIELFKAALSVLADVPIARVDGLTDQCDGSAFGALYRKAGLPLELLDAMRIALKAAQETDWSSTRRAGLSCRVIERVLTACDAINTGALDKFIVLLRRFESEAARDEIRMMGLALPRTTALRLEQDRFGLAPLLLTDIDVDEPRRVPARAMLERREPVFFQVNMAALEAELCAA